MSFDFRTTGNVYPRDDFKPRSERTLRRKSQDALVSDLVQTELELSQQLDWTRVALDALTQERQVNRMIREKANATIKAYEEAFDAKDAQIAALTAALVAARPRPTTDRVNLGDTGIYVRTDR